MWYYECSSGEGEKVEELDALTVTVVAEDSVAYETPYLGQHGISLFLNAVRGETSVNILMDVGQNPKALLTNMELLSISPGSIDMIVLTHCHYDHTQGLVEIIKATGKRNLPVVAHPDLFRVHVITDPFLRYIGVPGEDRNKVVEEAGGILCLVSDPLELMPGLMTSGEIQMLTDYEEVGMALKTIRNGNVSEDSVVDDLSLFAVVKNRGLVVMTGCGHRGIVNIVRQGVRNTDTRKIASVIGGFHLIESSDEKIEKTAEGLKDLDIDSVKAGHCTGFKAQVELYHVFKDAFSPMHAGDIYRF